LRAEAQKLFARRARLALAPVFAMLDGIQMKILAAKILAVAALFFALRATAELSLADSPGGDDFVLFDGKTCAPVLIETNANPAILRAANDLTEDFARVTGITSPVENQFSKRDKTIVIIGEIGESKIIDALAAAGKLQTNGITGAWESYVLQIVTNPLPGIDRALVIAGSDRRGTIYGIYQLSEIIGVSPWNWWADVPVQRKNFLALHGDIFKQGTPAVKYRGIFLNDEDWGLRPWASKTLEPENGNIGPKTYAKIFELLLRLHANYLWPAMHPGTTPFNSFATNKFLADEYGIVMGSSHCEQMLRDNIGEWDEKTLGDYNFVTNPNGVLNYWEQRVRENGKFENIYTLGMRGISDGAMPGGGTEREKAARLEKIISAQREMLARDVNTNVAAIPQIFCPYKEVLPLYRLMTNLPADITLVWPDDNYGYVREFSDARERARTGGAGVYYHVSYWGRPRDYLWLCSTPPALIAEEMTKAYDYGANKVWILNVGDLKPAELDIEFFLKLAWNPHLWNGTNTYDLLQIQIARDFGNKDSAEITSILAEYYRLNFQRKPEHIGFPTNNLFSVSEVAQQISEWQKLSMRVDAIGKNLSPKLHDVFFELVEYPVRCAALENEKFLAPEKSQLAQNEIERLTDTYNNQIAGGKWHLMMSDNPRGQLNLPVSKNLAENSLGSTNSETNWNFAGMDFSKADFAEKNQRVVMEAAHASAFVPGKDADWQKITGLGYNGEAASVFPTTIAVRDTPEKILAESPCLQFKIYFQNPGDWKFTVRALPTFSVETGKPQRYAIALDDKVPQIISLPFSMSETDKRWQENVLRNAALTSSVHSIANPGLHVLKIWMVDPGIVIDAIEAETTGAAELGYVWPPETRIRN
jgi:hypothetical protein